MPVTGRDEPWPFFRFWRHHFWPKLASSILNFCRRKRSFQWCPDQSDQPNGALDTHKNAQKVEWKTQSKISCHYTWLLRAKSCPSRWRFLRSFLTAIKPSRRSIAAAKKKKKGEKGKAKTKFQTSKSLSKNFDFCACPSHNVVKRDASGKKGKLLCCKRIFDQIKANLAEIQPKNYKMSKTAFFAKSSKSQWANCVRQRTLSSCSRKRHSCNFWRVFIVTNLPPPPHPPPQKKKKIFFRGEIIQDEWRNFHRARALFLAGVEFHVLPCVLVCSLVEFDLFAFNVLSCRILDCASLPRKHSPEFNTITYAFRC